MPNTPSQNLQEILHQIEQIQTMERGTLAEEYRERSDASGGTVRLGPYFKHQVWENGSNRSRRVPPREVPLLRQDLENHSLFTQLVGSYEAIAVAQTRTRRGKENTAADPDSKKNSTSKSSKSVSRKPKRSSS